MDGAGGFVRPERRSICPYSPFPFFSFRGCRWPKSCAFLEKNFLGGDLGLGLKLTANLGAGQDVLTILVELELVDDNVGGVDAERDGLARGLVASDTLDVDDVFETVDGGDLALTALVGATDDGDLVVLADGDAADVVLLTELLAERGAHDVAALRRRGLEVSGAALAARRGGELVDLLNHVGGIEG